MAGNPSMAAARPAPRAHWCAWPGCSAWGAIRNRADGPWYCGPHDRAAMLAGEAAAQAEAPAAEAKAGEAKVGEGGSQRFAAKQGTLL